MFLLVSVILLTGEAGDGVCLSACWDTTPTPLPPLEQTPPGADTPPPRAGTPQDPPPPVKQTLAYGQ